MSILDDMRELCESREEAQTALEGVMREVRATTVDAVQMGYPISRISREMGITRQTVYTILREEGLR